VGLAVGATTGRRATAIGAATAGVSISYLAYGLASAADSISWLRRLTPFYYDNGSNPLLHGLDLGHLGVLAAVTVILVATSVIAFDRRDLRR
jgi:ABC-2 type transport system permease protein